MLKVVSNEPLELRGVASKTTKNGKSYYVINAEDSDGTAFQLYCPTYEAIPQGLKKGDKVRVHFLVIFFGRDVRLTVEKVERVANGN